LLIYITNKHKININKINKSSSYLSVYLFYFIKSSTLFAFIIIFLYVIFIAHSLLYTVGTVVHSSCPSISITLLSIIIIVVIFTSTNKNIYPFFSSISIIIVISFVWDGSMRRYVSDDFFLLSLQSSFFFTSVMGVQESLFTSQTFCNIIYIIYM
jgi:hypothetical protein